MNQPIQDIMETTLRHLKDMVTVETVVGTAVNLSDGTVVIPVSKICVGFTTGGGEYGLQSEGKNSRETGESYPFAGGTGAGVSVKPVAFLVAGNGKVQMLSAEKGDFAEQLVQQIPGLALDLKELLSKGKCSRKSRVYPLSGEDEQL